MVKAGRLAEPLMALCLLFSSAPVYGQGAAKALLGATLTVTDSGRWRQVQQAVEYRKIALERSEPNYTFELKLLRFDGRLILPRILPAAQFQLKSATAKTFLQRSAAIATINANYFDPKGRPLAYLRAGEKAINHAISKHALYTGIFAVHEGVATITHRDDFRPAQASEALQSGPLLLARGEPVAIMRGLGRYARRALLGIDKEGHVIIAVTDAVLGGISFDELQELFSHPKWQLETLDLLNLDGGGSAQLHVKTGKFEESIAGNTEVPVAIGFFAKPN